MFPSGLSLLGNFQNLNFVYVYSKTKKLLEAFFNTFISVNDCTVCPQGEGNDYLIHLCNNNLYYHPNCDFDFDIQYLSKISQTIYDTNSFLIWGRNSKYPQNSFLFYFTCMFEIFSDHIKIIKNRYSRTPQIIPVKLQGNYLVQT